MKILFDNPIKANIWIIIAIMLLVLIGGVFYWVQIRPSMIRSNCYKRAKKLSNEFTSLTVSYLYRDCLMENGLRVEDL